MDVISCSVPEGTALARFRDSGEYRHTEAAKVRIPEAKRIDARELARVTMSRPSLTPERALKLVDLWIRIQSVILRPLGVGPNSMRSGRPQSLPEPGERLGPYQVLKADEREVLLGDADALIEHRMSFVVTDEEAFIGVVLRTKNKGGEAYWNKFSANQTQILHESLRRGMDLTAGPEYQSDEQK